MRDVSAKQILLYVDGALAVSKTIADTELGPMTDDGVSDPITIYEAPHGFCP